MIGRLTFFLSLVIAVFALPGAAAAAHDHAGMAASVTTEATVTRYSVDDRAVIEGMADPATTAKSTCDGGPAGCDCTVCGAGCADLARLFAEVLLPHADRSAPAAKAATEPPTNDLVPPLPPPRG